MGDTTFKKDLCKDCKEQLHIDQGYPYVTKSGDYFCVKCGLKRGLVAPLEYLDITGLGIYHHATYDYDKGVIAAYRKCGRGFSRDEIRLENWG